MVTFLLKREEQEFHNALDWPEKKGLHLEDFDVFGKRKNGKSREDARKAWGNLRKLGRSSGYTTGRGSSPGEGPMTLDRCFPEST